MTVPLTGEKYVPSNIAPYVGGVKMGLTRSLRARRRPYHHPDLPAALVREALAVLEREGDADFTVRSLARHIGVSHAAPYAHFPTKTALLAEVATEGFVRLGERMRTAREQAGRGAPAVCLQALGSAYIGFGREQPALYRLMFGAELSAANARFPRLAAAGEAAYALLLEAVATLSGGANVADAQVRAQAFAAWSAVHGATQLIIDGRAGNLRSTAVLGVRAGIDALCESVLATIARGIASDALD